MPKICPGCEENECARGQSYCNRCKAARMRAKRQAEAQEPQQKKPGKKRVPQRRDRPPEAATPGRPARVVDFSDLLDDEEDNGRTPSVPMDQVNFQEVLDNPAKRVTFMVERHQDKLRRYDRHLAWLEKALFSAMKRGDAADVKFYADQQRKTLKDCADYDLRMSEEIELWRGFAEKEREETDVAFEFDGVPV